MLLNDAVGASDGLKSTASSIALILGATFVSFLGSIFFLSAFF